MYLADTKIASQLSACRQLKMKTNRNNKKLNMRKAGLGYRRRLDALLFIMFFNILVEI